MKKLLILTPLLFFVNNVFSQVGYGTNNPDPRSVIELQSTDKAFYLPRLTDAQIAAQSNWKAGMLVFNTDKNCVYQRNNTQWECIVSGSAGPWFGTDNNASADDNAEDMYILGNMAVGQSTVTSGKVATFAGDVDIQGVLDPTKIIFSNKAGTNSSFTPNTNGAYEVEFTEDIDLNIKSNTNDKIIYIDKDGLVGINQVPQKASVIDMSSTANKTFQLPNVALGSLDNTISPPIPTADLEDGMLIFNTTEPVQNNGLVSSTFPELNYSEEGTTSKVSLTPFGVPDHEGFNLGLRVKLDPGGTGYRGLLIQDAVPPGQTISATYNVSFYIRKISGNSNTFDLRVRNPNNWIQNQTISTSWERKNFTISGSGNFVSLFIGETTPTATDSLEFELSGFQVSAGAGLLNYTPVPNPFSKGVYRWNANQSTWGKAGSVNDDAWGVSGEDRINDAARIGRTGIGTLKPETQLHVTEGENHGGVWFEIPSNGSGANLVIGDAAPEKNGAELLIKTNNPNINVHDNNTYGLGTGWFNFEGVNKNYVFGVTSNNSTVFEEVVFLNAKPTLRGFRWHTNPSSSQMTTSQVGSQIMRLNGNGNLSIAGTLTQNSDQRLKKDIKPISGALKTIEQLNGFYYNWKEEAHRSKERQIGFIAQEVEKVLPELVREDDEGYKSLNYSGIVPVLVEAVKELKKDNDKLRELLKKQGIRVE